MNLQTIRAKKFSGSALAAGLTTLCGLILGYAPIGSRWVNASYDCLFRFGARPITNQVVAIVMDEESYEKCQQVRGKPWNRQVHADLLNRLKADGCRLVVLDTLLAEPGDPVTDKNLSAAIESIPRMALMAKLKTSTDVHAQSVTSVLPLQIFADAAHTNWGFAWFVPDRDHIVRRHWPFPAPDAQKSLAWVAAELTGATMATEPREQWLRYYGENPPWTELSYYRAQTSASNYFRDKIVFIGNKPRTPTPDDEEDEFRTPYTRLNGASVGGVELNLTAFLNLVNQEWLRRPPVWAEILGIVSMGIALGGGMWRMSPLRAGLLAAAVGFAVMIGAVCLSFYTNFWVPWLVLAGGQVPCAWICSVTRSRVVVESTSSSQAVTVRGTVAVSTFFHALPETPDYELVEPPFGEGAFGKVWLAQNAIGQWQALKAVYRSNFRDNPRAYEIEFRGIERYKPISDKHPGLLRVDFVSRQKPEGYFYYVMELGDALKPGWKLNPIAYVPADLRRRLLDAPGKRLPPRECIRIALELSEALGFLHEQGLTHRDIKPQNIIFVNDHPKLADVGLVAEVRPANEITTLVGTPGYMPPAPEKPGSPQADIYGLGMVLYVMRTGRDPATFPEVSTTLVTGKDDCLPLNAVIRRACHSDLSQRYQSAAQMSTALIEARQFLEASTRL